MTNPNPVNDDEPPAADENVNFDIFVKDHSDIRGMIAYCIYRFKKKNHFQEGSLTDPEKKEFRQSCVMGRKYDGIKNEADEIVARFADNLIKNHIRKKWVYDLNLAIIGGIIAALLAPLIWGATEWAIKSSGAAKHVAEMPISSSSGLSPPSSQ